MVNELGPSYLDGMTALFSLWAYDIVLFLLDLKNEFISRGKQHLYGWHRLKEEKRREEEREERKEQLHWPDSTRVARLTPPLLHATRHSENALWPGSRGRLWQVGLENVKLNTTSS